MSSENKSTTVPITDPQCKSINGACPYCNKSTCQILWCPVAHYCKTSGRQCIFDCHEGFCFNCSVFLYSNRESLKPDNHSFYKNENENTSDDEE
jgi:hypothetical protein